jgi:hypothetical protein
MKKLLIIAGLLGATTGLFAQGTLVFANLASGVNAPVTNSAGLRITSSNYVADLYFSTTTDAATSSLTPAGFNVAFSTTTGGGGGFFLGGVRTVTGAPGSIEAQVRVWDITAFASFAAALNGGGAWGVSGPIIINLAIPPAPAPTMAGLTAFGLTPGGIVPEPSTFALAGLGAAALLAFRRRK